MVMTRESLDQSICIFSYDRIFSHLLAGILRGHFLIIIVHNPKSMVKHIEREEMKLLLGDSALLDGSVISALCNSRAIHYGMPHVLLFLSPVEVQSVDARYQPCIDKILFKPAGTEEIITAVLEMTTQG